MKGRLRVLSGSGAILLVAIWFAVTCGHKENDPLFAGKRFSEHLKPFQTMMLAFASLDDLPVQDSGLYHISPAACAAVDQVGDTALPLLVKMIGARDSKVELWIQRTANKYPWLRRRVPPKQCYAGHLRSAARVAFVRLGRRAAPAIPDLLPLLERHECALDVMVALNAIRPKRASDILSLTNVFKLRPRAGAQPNVSMVQSTATIILASFGTAAREAEPILLERLRWGDKEVRSAAAVALVKIGVPAGPVVPWIIRNLPHTIPPNLAAAFPAPTGVIIAPRPSTEIMQVRRNIWALRQYDQHASPALPVLTNLQFYPEESVRQAASEAAAAIRQATHLTGP